MKHHQTQRPKEENEGIIGKPSPGASPLPPPPPGTFAIVA